MTTPVGCGFLLQTKILGNGSRIQGITKNSGIAQAQVIGKNEVEISVGT